MSSSSLHRSCTVFSYLLKQHGVYVHIICGPFTIRVTWVKPVYVCPFVHMCYAPKPRGVGGGTPIFSRIRRLGPFLGVQNSEFQYFFWFSEKIIFFWGIKILWIFFLGHHKIGLV